MFAPILTALVLSAPIVQAGTLTFTKAAAWKDRPPASSMRVAEFIVPKASGDSEDADVIIYYFAGGGGSVEANLQRWTSQFQSTKGPVRTTATVNGLELREPSEHGGLTPGRLSQRAVDYDIGFDAWRRNIELLFPTAVGIAWTSDVRDGKQCCDGAHAMRGVKSSARGHR